VVAQLDSDFFRIALGRVPARLVSYLFFEGRPVTTPAQWWNPVVFGNLRLAARRMGAAVDNPVFVVGMGRSGTTLLGRILAAHPSVGFLNEPKAMWHVIRDDEDVIGSYSRSRPGRLYLQAEDASVEVRQRAHALFRWYLHASRSRRVVDKYPELVFRHEFVRAIFPDARFLVAVRSPWSTLKSVAGWSRDHGAGQSDWWGLADRKWEAIWRQGVLERASNSDLASLDLAHEGNHLVRAAVEWVVTMREAVALATTDPRAHVMNYDKFVTDPRPHVRYALEFCELSPSMRTELYAETVVSGHGQADPPASLPLSLREAVESTWTAVSALG
jgi:sulfotransferase family protein